MNALITQRAAAPSLGDMMRLAETLAQSTMIPRDYQRNPANCLVAIQWGSEIGLGPLQAMQNVAVINGRPSVWGDAAAALVKGHPAYEWMREGVSGEGDARVGWCEIKRRSHEPERREFSVGHAKKAGLWGKAGPWTQYPDRMLQLRARGFALRDVFPDALRGVITAEEAQDMPPADEPRVVGVVTPDQPALAAPQPDEAGRTARSFSFDLLDDQLSQFVEVEEIRAYLAQPKVQAAHRKVMERGMGERWAEIVQRHYSRVLPDDETTAPNEEIAE
ncbi:MAG: hypothetical protein RLZZ187_2601 [Pseudomonadota bacterium]|jgi:hypothetical protein